ncbi:MAG: DUF1616 domain-containing protein [Candidatus Bathyarchaeia archaeon]
MLSLEDYKALFMVIGLVGVLLFASPALGLVLRLPAREPFSELYVLGPGRLAEGYPFNVKDGEDYLVYVGVRNHMGSSAYYVVGVKFRNQSEPLPNSTASIPSPLPTLYEYRIFIRDGDVWEAPLRFSLVGISFSKNACLVECLKINGVLFAVNKIALWDYENRGYYYQLFIELWIYDANLGAFKFHNIFVTLWLNATVV